MSKASILLVEDDKTQAKLAKEFLEKYGYRVTWAEDGKSAIKVAKTQKIDVVLLDLILPDLSGNEVCRWLKVDHDTRGIPIIMLTVKDTVNDKVTSLEAGADDYLPKPYDEVELNARIYACLRTKSLQDELRDKNRQLEELLGRVEHLAITDHLTGLYNRRRFESLIENEFKRTQRYNTPLSCMMIDIDHFKNINDTYGHRAGDTVLKELATIIKSSIREVDTAARWGGEEFIVLLSQTPKKEALHPAQRILSAISHHSISDVENKKITVSIGIASMPDSSIDSVDQFINASDLQLYEAKKAGRNRIEIA